MAGGPPPGKGQPEPAMGGAGGNGGEIQEQQGTDMLLRLISLNWNSLSRDTRTDFELLHLASRACALRQEDDERMDY